MIEYRKSFYRHDCDLKTILEDDYLVVSKDNVPYLYQSFIAQIVIGFPVKPIFAQEFLDGRRVVLSGDNFVYTMREYYNDRFRPQLPSYPELHNYKFSETPNYVKNRIENVVVSLYLVRHDASLEILNQAMFY